MKTEDQAIDSGLEPFIKFFMNYLQIIGHGEDNQRRWQRTNISRDVRGRAGREYMFNNTAVTTSDITDLWNVNKELFKYKTQGLRCNRLKEEQYKINVEKGRE